MNTSETPLTDAAAFSIIENRHDGHRVRRMVVDVELAEELEKELANRKADLVSARVEREIYTFQNKKLREQLHRSMQLFGNLTLELKKNAAYREMLAKTEAAINEAAILENAKASDPKDSLG